MLQVHFIPMDTLIQCTEQSGKTMNTYWWNYSFISKALCYKYILFTWDSNTMYWAVRKNEYILMKSFIYFKSMCYKYILFPWDSNTMHWAVREKWIHIDEIIHLFQKSIVSHKHSNAKSCALWWKTQFYSWFMRPVVSTKLLINNFMMRDM